MSNKVHSSSQGNIPFSWENQPGISKVKLPSSDVGIYAFIKLPPPPCQSDSPTSTHKVLGQNIQVPLPPCPFQPPVIRSSSRKGLRRLDDADPFLAAYKECTRNVNKQGKLSKNSKNSGSSKEGRIGSLFSCKHSCGVREDSLVKRSLSSRPAVRERLNMDSE